MEQFLGRPPTGAKSGKSFLVKIAPDGNEAWAKIFDAPNTTFNDFHCDATPYRFIEPNLKAVGATVSRGMPQAILLALDYATYAPLDARLNEVYSELRHTLTPAEKEALKQQELGWLKKRERFPNGDPQWTQLTKDRIRSWKRGFP